MLRAEVARARVGAAALVAVAIVAACSRGERTPQADDVFTLYVLGGSVALGHPYEPQVDFGRMAALLCDQRVDGVPIRVENLAGKGKAAAVCVDDAHRIAKEHPAAPGRAAAFIYIGNNEFVAYDRKPDLRKPSQRALFDVPLVTPKERAYVYARGHAALLEIIRSLRASNIEPIVATVAVNEADWEPHRSVLDNPAHAGAVQAALQAGDAVLQRGDPRAALQHFEAALALEPDFALARKRAGDCHRALGDTARARDDYQRAIDCDGGPFRDTSEQNRIVRDVCAAEKVELVDAPAILRRASTDGLVGWNFMWDNCHPTLDGYHRIAVGFVDALAKRFEIHDLRSLTLQEIATALGVDSTVTRRAQHLAGQYCYRTSVLGYDPRARLARAHHYLQQAAAMGPEDADITCSQAVLALIEAEDARAMDCWRRAWQLDAKLARERAGNPYVTQLLALRGLESAVAALR